MTRIKYRDKPVWHETGLHYDGRAIAVAESPAKLLLRLKGTRQVLEIPWTVAFIRAAMMKAASIADEKKRNRKNRGTRRGVFA